MEELKIEEKWSAKASEMKYGSEISLFSISILVSD
jgi:hypothetical protein